MSVDLGEKEFGDFSFFRFTSIAWTNRGRILFVCTRRRPSHWASWQLVGERSPIPITVPDFCVIYFSIFKPRQLSWSRTKILLIIFAFSDVSDFSASPAILNFFNVKLAHVRGVLIVPYREDIPGVFFSRGMAIRAVWLVSAVARREVFFYDSQQLPFARIAAFRGRLARTAGDKQSIERLALRPAHWSVHRQIISSQAPSSHPAISRPRASRIIRHAGGLCPPRALRPFPKQVRFATCHGASIGIWTEWPRKSNRSDDVFLGVPGIRYVSRAERLPVSDPNFWQRCWPTFSRPLWAFSRLARVPNAAEGVSCRPRPVPKRK